jgi:DNA-binding NtrC family response regulator
LRVLDEGEVRPLGSNEIHHVSVRFLAATNRDPMELIRKGLLREDLYYRLRGLAIGLPPLRERLEDLPALSAHFLGNAASRLTSRALAELGRYGWPGNVRELRNVLRGALLLAGDGPIETEHLQLPAEGGLPVVSAIQAGVPSSAPTLKEIESQAILQALREARGHRGRAARALGIDRSTLRRKIRDLAVPEHGTEGPGP